MKYILLHFGNRVGSGKDEIAHIEKKIAFWSNKKLIRMRTTTVAALEAATEHAAKYAAPATATTDAVGTASEEIAFSSLKEKSG